MIDECVNTTRYLIHVNETLVLTAVHIKYILETSRLFTLLDLYNIQIYHAMGISKTANV